LSFSESQVSALALVSGLQLTESKDKNKLHHQSKATESDRQIIISLLNKFEIFNVVWCHSRWTVNLARVVAVPPLLAAVHWNHALSLMSGDGMCSVD